MALSSQRHSESMPSYASFASRPNGTSSEEPHGWSNTRNRPTRHSSFDTEFCHPDKRRRFLEEPQHDSRSYHQQLESERSYSGRMKASLDELERENAKLRRQGAETHELRNELHALRSENENLRKRQYEFTRLEQKLNHLRRENDEFRNRGYHDSRHAANEDQRMVHLRWQLGTVVNERDSLLQKAKSPEGQIHTSQASTRVNSDLQRRLDNALAENKTLNALLQHTKQQVKDLESQKKLFTVKRLKQPEQVQPRTDKSPNDLLLKHTQQKVKFFESQVESMNTDIVNLKEENESLQEEMEQMKMNHALELGFAGGN